MRLEIEFAIDEPRRININYNHYIMSSIYSLIGESNRDYSYFLHEEGYKIGNRRFKLFVYSRFLPESFEIEDKYMIINRGKARLYINSPVEEFINSLGDSLKKYRCMKMGHEEFRIRNIYLRDDIPKDYETQFITLSPIVITTGTKRDNKIKSRTVHIAEPKFIENIKNNLLRKYFLIHRKLPENMNIDIKFNRKYAKKSNRGHLINFKGIMVKGYMAPFTMRCDNSIKKIAIDCGLGENNSIGMGYIVEKT
mgnify:CR=1 FL=1